MDPLLDLYCEVLDEFVDQGKQFTAFDVTQEVRKRTSSIVHHYKYKNEVHTYMAEVVKDKLYSVNQHPDYPAQLYKPTKSVAQVLIDIFSGKNTTRQPSSTNVVSNNDISVTKSLDSRRKLVIPNLFRKAALLQKGDGVLIKHITKFNGSRRIIVKSNSSNKDYTVDVRGNLRISNRCLPLSKNNKYQISINKHKEIVIDAV